MKTLNRTLSLVLVLVMVLGMFGVAGATFKDQDKIENTEAVDTMVALNIINGKGDNTFDPAAGVTRAEMAKMICVALNGGKEPVLGTSSTPMFSDIKGHWGQKYIEYCTNLGIIAGMGDGTFAPDAAVTGSQAAKMMLVAMGYNADVFGLTGASWELTTNVEANKVGIYKDLSINASEDINRDNAAQLIFNGVFAGLMERTWTQDKATGKITEAYAFTTERNIASKYYNLRWLTGTLTTVSYDSVDREYDTTIAVYNSSSSKYEDKTFGCTVDYSSLYGQTVRVFYTSGQTKVTVQGIVPVKSKVVATTILGLLPIENIIGKGGSATEFSLNGSTLKFNHALSATPVYAQNEAIVSSGSLVGATVKGVDNLGSPNALADVKDANLFTMLQHAGVAKAAAAGGLAAVMPAVYQLSYTAKFIDNNGDGKVDAVVIAPFTVEQITYVGADTYTIGGNVYKKADISIYDGAAVNDFVKHTAAANLSSDTDTFEKPVVIEKGTVTAKTSSTATISGATMGDFANLTVGATYENINVVNGFIYRATLTINSVTAEKYAVVTKSASELDVYGNVKATLLLSDGESKEVTLGTVDGGAAVKNNGDTTADANEAFVGRFYTYTVSSGKYNLTKVADAGSYSAAYNSGGTAISYNYTKGTMTGNEIDDNAIIFAQTSATGYKVLTGAQLKTVKSLGTLTAEHWAFAKANASTGFSKVVMAYVDLQNKNIGATNYGYVTQDVATIKNADGVDVSVVTFWDGTKEVTLTADDNYTDPAVVTSALAKGTIFSYTVDKDNVMTIIDTDGAGKVDFVVTTKGSVDGYDAAKPGIVALDTGNAIINSNTVIFNLKTSEKAAVSGNAIIKAETGNQNARYITDTDGAGDKYVVFIAIDIEGVIS